MSFEPNQYEFVVDLRRSGGETEARDGAIPTLFASRSECPRVETTRATIVTSGQEIDHALFSFGEAKPLDHHQYVVDLRFNGGLFSHNLAKKLKDCQRTQNTLRALVLGTKVHFRIQINGDATYPLFVKLGHRLDPMC